MLEYMKEVHHVPMSKMSKEHLSLTIFCKYDLVNQLKKHTSARSNVLNKMFSMKHKTSPI